MSNITQFFQEQATPTRGFRETFVGPVSTTWVAPSTATEVEVHCWGGGAPSGPGSGGGGGGYVRHIYPISPGETFSIIVGGEAGTSSVSCTSQSPTSPISATGGTNSFNPNPSLSYIGGSGAYTIAPGVDTSYTKAYNGGSGGFTGGGGAAGSPLGNGMPGKNSSTYYGGSGGGSPIFGKGGNNWYYMKDFYIGEPGIGAFASTQHSVATIAGAFAGGGGYKFLPANSTPFFSPAIFLSGSAGGVCGGGGFGGNAGGVGIVIIYHN